MIRKTSVSSSLSCLKLLAALLFTIGLSLQTWAENKPRVTINKDGVLLVDGRKILPIGFSNGPPPDGRTPEGKHAFAEIKDAGGTFFRTGTRGSNPWNQKTIESEQVWMDTAAQYGLYCWPRLRELSSLAAGDTKKEILLRRVINRFRNHPGLLLWKNVDEPQWGGTPVEPMVRAYKIIKELDPNHPVGLTHAPRGTVEQLRPYGAATDIFLLDIYPCLQTRGQNRGGKIQRVAGLGWQRAGAL